MVRIFGILAGLGFVFALLWSLFTTPLTVEHPESAAFVETHHRLDLPSNGIFGRFDQAQLQRGLKVYKEVCAACHGLSQVRFGSLEALGYDENQVKTLAAEFQVASINPDTGEPASRPGLPSDRFPSPYPNEVAARAANGGAYPPDLSLITKARHGGAAYVHALLMGYRDPPANLPASLRPGPGLYYNPVFPNLNIAMPSPIMSDGQVTYDDGTTATRDQMSTDVAAFLVWAAEPELATRHAVGWAVLAFLLVFTVLTYMSYRAIWADKKGR